MKAPIVNPTISPQYRYIWSTPVVVESWRCGCRTPYCIVRACSALCCLMGYFILLKVLLDTFSNLTNLIINSPVDPVQIMSTGQSPSPQCASVSQKLPKSGQTLLTYAAATLQLVTCFFTVLRNNATPLLFAACCTSVRLVHNSELNWEWLLNFNSWIWIELMSKQDHFVNSIQILIHELNGGQFWILHKPD